MCGRCGPGRSPLAHPLAGEDGPVEGAKLHSRLKLPNNNSEEPSADGSSQSWVHVSRTQLCSVRQRDHQDGQTSGASRANLISARSPLKAPQRPRLQWRLVSLVSLVSLV